MIDKLMQARQKAEEIKARLNSILVTGEAEAGKVRVTATANSEIRSIMISDELLAKPDREQLEELLIVATNKALEQAAKINQAEMQAATQEMTGDMGWLDKLFNT